MRVPAESVDLPHDGRCLQFLRRAAVWADMARTPRVSGLLVVLLLWLGAGTAYGLPGTHGPAVSTFDTRSSTVVLAYRHDLSEVTSRVFSYNANFTSTSGNFSAQFGAHYFQFRDIPEAPLAHGAGATGVGLFSLPVTRRYDNGLPVGAVILYLGATPAAMVSGPRNFLTAPLAVGTGFSYSPWSWLSLTPWFEVAPSADLDTYISTEGVEIRPTRQLTAADLNDPIGNAGLQDSFRQALDDAVDTRFSINVSLRTGLLARLEVQRRFDFQLGAEFSSLGSAFGGAPVFQLTSGVSFHWDHVVPAVLPPDQRLSNESCDAIEARFRTCPAHRRWLEQSLPPAPGHTLDVETQPTEQVLPRSDSDATPLPPAVPVGPPPAGPPSPAPLPSEPAYPPPPPAAEPDATPVSPAPHEIPKGSASFSSVLPPTMLQ